jgi:EAL domain-containing protein (putative c-di-GMP-specific phosphodiesterase class I)
MATAHDSLDPPGASADPSAVVRRLLADRGASATADAAVAAARAHLGMDVAFLSEFVEDRQFFRVVEGDSESFHMPPGSSIPLEASYCPRMTRGSLPSAIPDVRGDPLVREMAITDDANVGAYIGVPVRFADGDLYGTLCGLSHASHELRERDVRFLQVLAAIIADELCRDPQCLEERRRHAQQITRALDGTGVMTVLQPIVRLDDRVPVGFEALTRFDGHVPPRPPDEWFAAAWDIGVGEELELIAVRKALGALDRLPDELYLSVNVDPRAVVSAGFLEAIESPRARRLLVELTEHAPVTDYEPLARAIGALRQRGVRFAVDDAGAGYAGLNHIVRVAPDVVKLDRFLTRGVDTDPARQALTASAAAFAAATRTRVIAEGIETPGELQALRAAGIRYGQGYHLGRPGPLEEVVTAI